MTNIILSTKQKMCLLIFILITLFIVIYKFTNNNTVSDICFDSSDKIVDTTTCYDKSSASNGLAMTETSIKNSNSQECKMICSELDQCKFYISYDISKSINGIIVSDGSIKPKKNTNVCRIITTGDLNE